MTVRPAAGVTAAVVVDKAMRLCEEHGWSRVTFLTVRTTLTRLLAEPLTPGERVSYQRIRRTGNAVKRVAEVLAALDLLDDDRTPAIDGWIDRKTVVLPPGFQSDVGNWLRQLRYGHSRARPRADATLYNYYGALTAVLHEWGTRYAALREVTRDDVTGALAPLSGRPRGRLLTALRSLFDYLRRVFHDPTTRLRQPKPSPKTLLPLDSTAIAAAVGHAVTPTLRLILILAAFQAVRPQAIRLLTLDDLDLANQRITIGGHRRSLDAATAAALREHLAERHARWPRTLNRHVLLSKQSALTDAPVSTYYFKQHFVPAGIRLDRIRLDRVLDEALTHGPDPLHLCTMFGLNEFAAIRIIELAGRLDSLDAVPLATGRYADTDPRAQQE